MRTPGERTSGAWTGGCAIHPDGGDETDRTAGNSYGVRIVLCVELKHLACSKEDKKAHTDSNTAHKDD